MRKSGWLYLPAWTAYGRLCAIWRTVGKVDSRGSGQPVCEPRSPFVSAVASLLFPCRSQRTVWVFMGTSYPDSRRRCHVCRIISFVCRPIPVGKSNIRNLTGYHPFSKDSYSRRGFKRVCAVPYCKGFISGNQTHQSVWTGWSGIGWWYDIWTDYHSIFDSPLWMRCVECRKE